MCNCNSQIDTFIRVLRRRREERLSPSKWILNVRQETRFMRVIWLIGSCPCTWWLLWTIAIRFMDSLNPSRESLRRKGYRVRGTGSMEGGGVCFGGWTVINILLWVSNSPMKSSGLCGPFAVVCPDFPNPVSTVRHYFPIKRYENEV